MINFYCLGGSIGSLQDIFSLTALLAIYGAQKMKNAIFLRFALIFLALTFSCASASSKERRIEEEIELTSQKAKTHLKRGITFLTLGITNAVTSYVSIPNLTHTNHEYDIDNLQDNLNSSPYDWYYLLGYSSVPLVTAGIVNLYQSCKEGFTKAKQITELPEIARIEIEPIEKNQQDQEAKSFLGNLLDGIKKTAYPDSLNKNLTLMNYCHIDHVLLPWIFTKPSSPRLQKEFNNPNSLVNLAKKVELDLSDTHVTQDDIAYLTQKKNIISLYLRNSGLNKRTSGMFYFANNLKTLDIRGNPDIPASHLSTIILSMIAKDDVLGKLEHLKCDSHRDIWGPWINSRILNSSEKLKIHVYVNQEHSTLYNNFLKDYSFSYYNVDKLPQGSSMQEKTISFTRKEFGVPSSFALENAALKALLERCQEFLVMHTNLEMIGEKSDETDNIIFQLMKGGADKPFRLEYLTLLGSLITHEFISGLQFDTLASELVP